LYYKCYRIVSQALVNFIEEANTWFTSKCLFEKQLKLFEKLNEFF